LTLILEVSKGLSNYLKIDANIIRVVFVVSLFFGGAGLLFYLLLWIFTKEAKTIGEKMNMSGFNVNLSNIEDFIKKKLYHLKILVQNKILNFMNY